MRWRSLGEEQNKANLYTLELITPPPPRRAQAKSDLGADEQVGDAGGVLLQLRHPLLPHVLEAGGVDHGEAYEEDVGHGVGQRPEAVIVLLQGEKTGGVRKASAPRATGASATLRRLCLAQVIWTKATFPGFKSGT